MTFDCIYVFMLQAIIQAQKHHQHQHVSAPQQQQQQAVVPPGVQLANMAPAQLGPITSTQTSFNWFPDPAVGAPPSTAVASPHHGVHMQYPTPPSHHSGGHLGGDGGTPQHMTSTTNFPPEHHYLTPSPDSPGQWSSSSPHSAQSDWSEGISSPTQPVTSLQPPPPPPGKIPEKRDNNSVYL